MDDILPEKALFESLVFNLQDNLRSIELLSQRGCKPEMYACNIQNAKAICQELRNLKWKYWKPDEDDGS